LTGGLTLTRWVLYSLSHSTSPSAYFLMGLPWHIHSCLKYRDMVESKKCGR
jgi:hypothetical protein